MKKYLVIGGMVLSASGDGDEHYISPPLLIDLYDVDPADCITFRDEGDPALRGVKQSDYIVLRPRRNGDYSTRPASALSQAQAE